MMISSRITRANAAAASVPLMPSKTLMASAEYPAEPVTFTWRPPPGSLTMSRTFSTGFWIVFPFPSVSMSANSSALVASLENCGAENLCVAGRVSALSCARSAAIRARSAGVRPSSRR